MSNLSETLKVSSPERAPKNEVYEILSDVFFALKEKGYNPINQIVGYILSGDPTYVTSHNDARARITKLERDELLEEILCFYLQERG